MKQNVKAFTLAEVLITLGIIGVVAAMTLPNLIQNYQKMVLKNQFKTSYSKFYNAVMQSQANLGGNIGCSYWVKQPDGCIASCTGYHPIYNTCTGWKCKDGSSLPGDYNGPRTDCTSFETELFTKVLKITKECKNNALSKGCLTAEYKGTDKVKSINNPDAEYPPNPGSDYSDSNIKQVFSSWLLTDGTLIIKYGTYPGGTAPIYTIDINGHKKPNQWGYDIFTFQLMGDVKNGITKMNPITYATEKGGVSTAQMLLDMNK